MSRPAPVTGHGPSQAVRDAFAVVTDPVLLDGGQRRTWRAGDVVLKPVDDPVEEHVWLCETYNAWPAAKVVRVPRPLRTTNAAWSAHGWSAHRWLEGETVRAGDAPAAFRRTVDAFHEVVSGFDRPSFLDRRDDAWSIGDRVAWEGREPEGSAETAGRTGTSTHDGRRRDGAAARRTGALSPTGGRDRAGWTDAPRTR